MTQRQDVLRMLRHAGARGVHSFEMREAYVANPSQRILELEALGHAITHHREKFHGDAFGTRYKLIGDVEVPAGTQASPPSPATGGDPDAPPPLFDLPRQAPDFDALCPRPAIFDDEEAA